MCSLASEMLYKREVECDRTLVGKSITADSDHNGGEEGGGMSAQVNLLQQGSLT